MVRKKSPLAPASRRMRAYEIPGLVNVNVQPDPIREIESDAIRDLSNEYRTLRIEELIAKKRRQLSASKPDSSKDTLEIFKAVSDFQKANKPESADKTINLVKTIYDLVKGGGSNTPSFFEQYLQGRELGIFHQAEAGEANQFSVEMEKLRGQRMMESKKFDLELTKLRLQHEDDRNRTDMLISIAAPILAFGGDRMAQNMKQRGMNAANQFRNPSRPSPEVEMLRELSGQTAELQISCDCGFSKPMLIPVPPPPQISCPNCGKILKTGEASPASDAEVSSQWRQEI